MGFYYTMWDKIKDTGELYKEWVGEVPDFKGIQSNSLLIVAHDRGKIIGAAQLIVVDDPVWGRRWGLVENVLVSRAYRRKGIGTGLMKSVEEQARLLGCSFIKLTSGKDEGKGLYRSMKYGEGSSFRKEL